MKAFFFACCILICQTLQAQTGNLVIFSGAADKFVLSIGGQISDLKPTDHLKTTQVPAAIHELKLTFQDPKVPAISHRVQVQADRELTLAVVRSNADERKLIFVNESALSVTLSAPMEQVVRIWGTQAAEPSVEPMHAGPAPTASTVPVKDTLNVKAADPVPAIITPTKPEAPQVVTSPGYTGPRGCPNAIDDQSFQGLLKQIAAQGFSADRLETARKVTQSQCLLCRQTVQVMELFAFDSDKLAFALHAYPQLFDSGNIHLVKAAFTFPDTEQAFTKQTSAK